MWVSLCPADQQIYVNLGQAGYLRMGLYPDNFNMWLLGIVIGTNILEPRMRMSAVVQSSFTETGNSAVGMIMQSLKAQKSCY